MEKGSSQLYYAASPVFRRYKRLCCKKPEIKKQLLEHYWGESLAHVNFAIPKSGAALSAHIWTPVVGLLFTKGPDRPKYSRAYRLVVSKEKTSLPIENTEYSLLKIPFLFPHGFKLSHSVEQVTQLITTLYTFTCSPNIVYECSSKQILVLRRDFVGVYQE